jgi:hypothetical protein
MDDDRLRKTNIFREEEREKKEKMMETEDTSIKEEEIEGKGKGKGKGKAKPYVPGSWKDKDLTFWFKLSSENFSKAITIINDIYANYRLNELVLIPVITDAGHLSSVFAVGDGIELTKKLISLTNTSIMASIMPEASAASSLTSEEEKPIRKLSYKSINVNDNIKLKDLCNQKIKENIKEIVRGKPDKIFNTVEELLGTTCEINKKFHCTLEFFPGGIDFHGTETAKPRDIKIKGFVYEKGKGLAFIIDKVHLAAQFDETDEFNIKPDPLEYHITIAYPKRGKPVYSNQIITKWKESDNKPRLYYEFEVPFTITGTDHFEFKE